MSDKCVCRTGSLKYIEQNCFKKFLSVQETYHIFMTVILSHCWKGTPIDRKWVNKFCSKFLNGIPSVPLKKKLWSDIKLLFRSPHEIISDYRILLESTPLHNAHILYFGASDAKTRTIIFRPEAKKGVNAL